MGPHFVDQQIVSRKQVSCMRGKITVSGSHLVDQQIVSNKQVSCTRGSMRRGEEDVLNG